MPSYNQYYKIPAVEIGNDVWIGDGVFIKNGVKVGDGAVIGSKAMVTKDVPPYAIVVGVPAKVLKYRFSDDVISSFLELKWWDLDDDVIRKIPYDNIVETLDFLRKCK